MPTGEVWFLITIFNHDGKLCVYTCVFTERKKEGERDQRFSCFASFSAEINTLPES